MRVDGFTKFYCHSPLRYGSEVLGIETFTAKIKFGNVASEKLFAKLGFVVESRSEVFEETTFQLKVEILLGVINNCVF